MQHDQTKMIGLQKMNRTRSARTPDRLNAKNMDESMVNSFSPKRKFHTSRLSMMPPHLNTSTINLRKMELENNNLELELYYSEYLASQAESFLENKILKDTEVSLCNSMKNIQEDIKSLHEKNKIIETRINDVKALSNLDDYAELTQFMTSSFTDKLKTYEIQNILSQLEKLLDPFNILRCENIVLPSNIEEVQQLQKTLTDCHTVLQNISDSKKCNELENISTEYEEFIRIFNEILNVKKIVEEKIGNLQCEILKTCSHNLSQSNV